MVAIMIVFDFVSIPTELDSVFEKNQGGCGADIDFV